MDVRLQTIIDDIKLSFGLDMYTLETYSIHKERNSRGDAFYKFNMEFFPSTHIEPVEEDVNPAGTAVVEYNIQSEKVESIVFVERQSFATKTHFTKQTAEEIAAWVEEETGFTYERDFKLSDTLENGFQFKSDVDGIEMTPAGMIEVEFDKRGKLTSFIIYDAIPAPSEVVNSDFTLTLEDIEPLVKAQLQLVNFPHDGEKRFVPVYAMEEVYITMDGSRIIPYLEHERFEVKIDEVLEWDTPLEDELTRVYPDFVSEATVDEAFENIGLEEKLFVSTEQVEQCKPIVRDVLRTVLPLDSGKWKLNTLQRHENFIEAVCAFGGGDSSFFNRKFVVLIHPQTMGVLNYLDNGEMFEIFDTFEPAEEAVVTHDDAFETLLSYITLTPAYVYDVVTGNYLLCGLLDAPEGVDAVSGDIVPLSDF